jgi:uncharacterized FAD-dependent dehydrogenase
MIRINQVRLGIDEPAEHLVPKAAKLLRVPEDRILEVRMVRRSVDARKKPQIFYSCTVDVRVRGSEAAVVRKAKNVNIAINKNKVYHFPVPESGSDDRQPLRSRPVIIGFGPAGMFAARMLAEAGYAPLVLERGDDVEMRTRKVRNFWAGGELDPESNVQFGEGGAGTFSDGKLNTMVKDPEGRNRKVLEIFAEAGADPEILYVHNPHIGTDVLAGVVRSIREDIIRRGGEIRFSAKVTDIGVEDGKIVSVTAGGQVIPAEAVILAPGHSARDTFAMLAEKNLRMAAKPFAVGVRIQHPQAMINLSQYGREDAGKLGPASYKLTHQTGSGRGVYSFCMCPGGSVVNASSERGLLAVNGMSSHDRDSGTANSAIVVTVSEQDFCRVPGAGEQTPGEAKDLSAVLPLAGMEFQRMLERRAYAAGQGKIPVQLCGDFKENRISREFGDVIPVFSGKYAFGDVRGIFPEEIQLALLEGLTAFGRKIRGFDRADAILAGVESRTSSPVRIPRNGEFEAEIAGLYPCGEGAGYAGGITSAAMDGMKAAEAVAKKYKPDFP